MKKLIAALTLMLAFSINANAQDKSAAGTSYYDLGKKQAAELTNFLGLDQTQNENFARLFEQKFSILDNKNFTQERKDEFSRVVEDKIRGSLDPKQMAKLDANKEFLKKLTH